MVRLTTPKPWKEHACWVYPQELPELSYDSLVHFGGAMIVSAIKLDALATSGTITPATPVDAVVTTRIVAAVPGSRAEARVKRFVSSKCCP